MACIGSMRTATAVPTTCISRGITASMPAGSLVGGSLVRSFIADRIQCASQNIDMLCAGRVVAGLCVGIDSSVVLYFIQYGAAQVDGGPEDPSQPSAAFRIPWGIQMIPALILLIDAMQVLASLHGAGDARHPKVLAEYKEIEDALRFEREEACSSFRALVQPRIFTRVILGMSIQMWCQHCGMNIMMYYIVYIMENAQIASPLLPFSMLSRSGTLPAILYLDKFGCRSALIVGAFFMMVILFTSVKNKPAVSKGIVAASYLFVATFAPSWGPTSWIYPTEIFPSRVRAKAVSLSTASNWFWNMILAFAVPPLLWYINWKMYMIFAAFNGAAFINMTLMPPETKGYTLEEMDELAWDIELGHVKVAAPRRQGSAATSTAIGLGTTGEDEVEKVNAQSHHLEIADGKGSQG
ncbi:general substrate transporter [Xylaria arbuscula]|nr:general substrate transporter [Xylaria arbuscula]